MRTVPRMARCILLAVAAVAAICVASRPVAAAVAITTCDQIYSGATYMTGDVDCTSTGGQLHFFKSARLAMNGFTLTGFVLCGGKCKITGPGTISGGAEHGVRATEKVTLVNVTVTGSGENGVEAHNFAETAKALIRDSTINGNAGHGVHADKIAKIQGSAISGNGGDGVQLGTSTCQRARLVVKNSTVTGNGVDAECGVSEACADITSCSRPKLLGTASCDTSHVLDSGLPGSSWGVCALD